MSGWKLWTSVALGVLSVGGGSTYYVWNRVPAADSASVVAESSAGVSPHALPPQPIPDASSELTTPQFATPVGFTERTEGSEGSGTPTGLIVRGNDTRSGFSGRPAFQPVPSTSPESLPANEHPGEAPAPVVGRYQSGVSDQSFPSDPQNIPDQAQGEPPAAATLREEPPTPSVTEAPPSSPATVAEESQYDPRTPADAPRILAEPPSASPTTAADATSETAAPANPADVAVETPAEPPPVPTTRSGLTNSMTYPADAGTDAASLRPNPSPLEASPTEVPTPRRNRDARNSAAAPRSSGLISNAPGERRLEGIQAPSLTIERSAPEEIQVGKPTKFVITVRNVGQVPAQEVTVSDQVPNGTRFVAASPEAAPAADGTLTWEIGTLQSGEDAILSVELLPEAEGEIGSVAEVTFRAQAAVRTIATKPLLHVEQSGPAKALIGDDVTFQITVSNPGTGIATGVIVEVDVPEGLAHDGGREIMTDSFDLRPNETRSFDLVLKAVQAGMVPNLVRAVGSGTLFAEHRTQLEIVAPKLLVNTIGATRRFLDRPVKYQIVVSNPGTAPAKQIELVAHLPRGLKFTAADQKGRYDQQTHAVAWSLEELPAGEQGVVELTAIPIDTGEQKLHIEGRAALGLEHQQEHTTVVEDITNLAFTISSESVPIEVGSETTYQIRVVNNGTKAARNVRLAAQLPEGLELVDSDGPTKMQLQGAQLVMQPISELGQREEAVYRLVAKGIRAGDHVLRVQLLCDEFTTPVTKEEITKVYADK